MTRWGDDEEKDRKVHKYYESIYCYFLILISFGLQSRKETSNLKDSFYLSFLGTSKSVDFGAPILSRAVSWREMLSGLILHREARPCNVIKVTPYQ